MSALATLAIEWDALFDAKDARLPAYHQRCAAFDAFLKTRGWSERAWKAARLREADAHRARNQSRDLYELELCAVDEYADAIIEALFTTHVRRWFDRRKSDE